MLAQRVASAAVLTPVVLVLLVVGQPLIALAVAVLAFLGARELFVLVRRAGYHSEPLLGASIPVAMVVEAWLLHDLAGESLVIVAAAVILAAVGGFLRRDTAEGFQAWVITVFGGVYVGLLSFAVLIVEAAPALPAGAPIGGLLDGGRAWLAILLFGVWAYDTGAYFAGRRWGRSRVLEHVSPGKTWAGVAGGTAAATLVCFVGLALAGQLAIGAIVLGPLLSFAAQTGDLAESLLKRAAGADESSRLIPGHGGLLDRIDSFLFAAPAVYFYLLIVAHIR